jgi:spermidine/putrescine transport system substrate-binding protein
MIRLPRPAAAVAALVAVSLVSCSKDEQPKLQVYTWADYFKPELLERFQTENNCRVVIDTFESNEAMMAKLQAGATGYDLITPTSYQVKAMNREGLLQPIDHARVPALAHIDPAHLAAALDPKMEVSVPYMVGMTVIAYRKDKLETPPADWMAFNDPAAKGRATLMNDMREVLGAALKQLGHSLNTTDDAHLEAAKQLVLQWKANIAKFDSEQYKSGIESGEFVVVQGYSGDILQVMEESEEIEIVVPACGVARSCDDFVIPKTAGQVDLAHRFIDFFTRPDIAAENMEYLGFLAPNKDAYPLLSEETRANPAILPSPEIAAKCEFIDDLGPAIAKYQKVWDEIKAGQ